MAAPKKSGSSTVTKSTRGDLAARRKAEIEAEMSAEQAAAAEHMSMATAAAQQEAETTIANYTSEPVSEDEAEAAGVTKEEVIDPSAPVLEDQGLEIDDEDEAPYVPPPTNEVVRPREDCRFTFGAGNEYRFSAGRAAKVPFEVAQHMREKGLIWD